MKRFHLFLVLALLANINSTVLRADDPPATQTPVAAEGAKPKKVVIFYTSIGAGHISAAKAIKANLEKKQPGIQVELKNMRDFWVPMSPQWMQNLSKAFDEKTFWFVVKNYPELFDRLYHGYMENGRKIPSLDQLKKYYDEKAILQYLKDQKADVALATFYGAAQVLGDLREKGELRDLPIGWLHTDYIDGYFPRVSQRIDKSFLPHPEMEAMWRNAGVDPSKFATTGMPLNPAISTPIDRVKFLTEHGLDPTKKVITLASGAEGVGNFPLMIESMARAIKDEPVQIVAVCSKNEAHQKTLSSPEFQAKLPKNVKLIVHGMVPHEDLLGLIKSSDVYVTKAGGLSPTEGFAIGRPMVILDVYGGHERENANLFERLNLAVVNRKQENVGADVARLIANPQLQSDMAEAQARFRNSLNLDSLIDFALTGRSSFQRAPDDFGREGGTMARNARQALQRLAHDSPAEIELILSHPMGNEAIGPYRGKNPFGHIAIRIGDKVYTANQHAVRGEDSALLLEMPLEEYLYGTKKPTKNAQHGSNFGVAYARDNVGLRISKIDPKNVDAMLAEIKKINDEWSRGITCFDWGKSNCADFTKRVMEKSGLEKEGASPGVGRSSLFGRMPLDTFEHYLKLVDGNIQIGGEMVSYNRLPDSRHEMQLSAEPLSIFQPIRALSAWWNGGKKDQLMARVTKRVGGYAGDQTVHYENIDRSSVGDSAVRASEARMRAATEHDSLKQMEDRMALMYQSIKDRGYEGQKVSERIRAFTSSLTPEEFDVIVKNKTGPPVDEAKKRAYAELMRFVGEAKDAMGEFHGVMDEFNGRKVDYIAQTYKDLLDGTMGSLDNHLNDTQRKKLVELHKKAKKHFEDYVRNRYLYNQPKDAVRITHVRDFMDTVQAFGTELDRVFKVAGFPTDEKAKSWLQRLGEFGSTVKAIVQATPAVANALLQTARAGRSGEGHTPLTASVMNVARTIGAINEFKVTVEGRENLLPQPPKGKKVVNIYSLQHANPILDNVVLSHLGVEDGAIFGAADWFGLGKWVADKFDNSDHFIVVGRGSDKPIDKAMEIVNSGKTRKLVIYPEGSVSAGVYDTRRPRDKFAWGLLERLRAEGYEVNIVPISLPQNMRFNTVWNGRSVDPNDRELRAVVHRPIDSRMLDVLMATGDATAVNHLQRQMWLDEMPNGTDHVAGMLKMDKLKDRSEQFVSRDMKCPRAMQAFLGKVLKPVGASATALTAFTFGRLLSPEVTN